MLSILPLLLLGVAVTGLWAAESEPATEPVRQEIVFSKEGNVWTDESSSGMQQIRQLMNQLTQAMGTLPPDIERVAIYQLRVDRTYFSPGMARFIRSQIEEVFRKEGRRAVISSPELKTTKVVVDDTSFTMSNSIPDAEALWSLGRKLRVDAFVTGSVTRSDEGDVLLEIKLVKQLSAEIAWSENLVAGPNEKIADRNVVEWGVSGGFALWPVAKYTAGGVTTDTAKISYYLYQLEMTVGEPVTYNRRIYLSFAAGLGMWVPVAENQADTTYDKLSFFMSVPLGAELLLVMVQKDDPREGYYLGMYGGARAVFPRKFLALQGGYSSRLTRHLGISLGASYHPFVRVMRPWSVTAGLPLIGSEDYLLEMEQLHYDARIHYYF
jgi:hypothetical protein